MNQFGRLEQIQRIATGAFGEVFRAYDPAARRDVAIKVIRSWYGTEERQTIEREIAQMRRLEAIPGITPVLGHGTTPAGHPYLVMPYANGGTLEDLLGQLSPSRVASIGSTVATALQRVHDVGIIHRDIKPSNILLTQDGDAFLSDFGVAVDVDRTMFTGPKLTPAYAPPESLAGLPATPSGDVYSLALSLVAALIGQAPRTLGGGLRSMIEDDPRRHVENEYVPTALGPILLAALEPEPENRPSAGRFAEEFRNLSELVSLPTTGSPYPRPYIRQDWPPPTLAAHSDNPPLATPPVFHTVFFATSGDVLFATQGQLADAFEKGERDSVTQRATGLAATMASGAFAAVLSGSIANVGTGALTQTAAWTSVVVAVVVGVLVLLIAKATSELMTRRLDGPKARVAAYSNQVGGCYSGEFSALAVGSAQAPSAVKADRT